jgi:hypothetical protein
MRSILVPDTATDPHRHHHGVLEGDRRGGPRRQCRDAVSDPADRVGVVSIAENEDLPEAR